MNPVYFYYPNLIGYGRVLSLAYGLRVAFDDPMLFLALYTLSMGLDAVDGHVARLFDQCSTFGAQLDMLCDRMTTMCLYVAISRQTPDWWLFSATFIALDVVSHWLQVVSKLQAGGKTHKDAVNPFLKLYYDSERRGFMLSLCVGQEVYLLMWFLKDFVEANYSTLYGALFNPIVCYFFFGLWALKQLANVFQLTEAADYYATNDWNDKKLSAKKVNTNRK